MTDALIGRTLRGGEYELREVIAHGGQATVYRAYARKLETDVAVKVLNQHLAADSEFRERFHDEARILAKLHHKNLVDVKCYDEDDELVYIVMRLVPGGTLKDRLQALGGSLGLVDAARTVGQIAEALQHAHDHGVLHLDIKPANVLLGQADWPLVTDLGLTRAIQEDRTSPGHTRVAGTPAYMSPEQCRGGLIDERSDQYSLAVTAYELLTGQQPFRAETTEALLQKQIETAPPRPRQINPGLPGPIEEVLLRGLAKNPADRFSRVADFGQALSEAVDRTRGVSLEAKLAAAATAPNLLAILALVLAAPFMLAILPVGNVLGRLPLAWPFQLLLAGSIAALLLGIRWHLIGLVGRGVGGALATLDRVSRQQLMLGTGTAGPLHIKRWQHTAVASVEGLINLLYVLATYRLVGAPVLAVARAVVDPSAYQILDRIALVVVGGVVLGVFGGILRGAGPIPAALVLALAWAGAITLPTFEVDLSGARTLALTAQLVVAVGLMLLLTAQRRSAGEMLGRLASTTVGRLVTEGRPGIRPEESAANGRQIERLACGVLDFGYLLLGYALLRGPVVDLLSPFLTPLAAAIVAAGVAAAIWLVLIVRLHSIAGLLGLVLGLVLGAPILGSLPVLDPALIQVRWPATIASWATAGALLALLAVVRGQTQTIGRAALGARIDRGLLGSSAAGTEEQAARRADALGGVANAFIDIFFLLIGYWVIGVPISNALIRMTHEPALGSVVLMCVLAIALGLILVPSRYAASTLADTGGAQWRARSRAFTVVALTMGAMLIAFGGAAPAAVAGPTVLSPASFTPDLARVAPRVIVDRDVWLPWSPLPEQATYNLALSCSDGRNIGQFREVYEPLPGTPVPAGNVGPLGMTNVACDDWRRLYQARRHAAGLTDAPSLSWEWLHVQATVNDDLSTDVVQTQRVFFSAGDHQTLGWSLRTPGSRQVSNLEVFSEGGSTAVKDLRVDQAGAERRLTWSIPPVVGPASQTFTIKYHVSPDATSDGLPLFEHLVDSPERDQPIWQAAVEVRLPAAARQQSLELSSDAPAVRTGFARDQVAWFEATDLPGSEAFTMTVNAPIGQSVSPTPTFIPIEPLAAPSAAAPPNLASAAEAPPVEIAGQMVAQRTATSTSVPTDTPVPTFEPSPVPQPTEVPAVVEVAVDTSSATPGGDEDAESVPTAEPAPTVQPTPTATPTVTNTATPDVTATVPPTSVPTAAPEVRSGSTAISTPRPTLTTSPTAPATATRGTSRGSGGSGASGGSADATLPVITHTISPAPNGLGWNHSPVTVIWTVSSPGSTIASTTGCEPATVSVATTATTLTCRATTSTGINASDAVLVKVDTTPPVLETTLKPALGSAGRNVEVTVAASKDLAGPPLVIASGTCVPTANVTMTLVGPVPSSSYVGTYSVPAGTTDCSVVVGATASDIAGNQGSGDAKLLIDRTPPVLRVTLTPNPVSPAGRGTVVVEASENLASAPTVTLRRAAGCLPQDLLVALSPTGQATSYRGTFSVPNIDGKCTTDVVVNGEDVAHNAVTTTTTLAITQARQKLTLAIKSAVSNTGDVVIDPPGLKCVADAKDPCSVTVARNQTVTLTADNANRVVFFDGWKGSDVCSGADTICKVLMDKDHTEVANFLERNVDAVVNTPTVPRTIAVSPVPSPSPTAPPALG